MDAFAVSVTLGLQMSNLRIRTAVGIALLFGFFQAIMPVLGWLAGFKLRAYIVEIDHWIVFGLLAIIGIKMIYESGSLDDKNEKNNRNNFLFLLVLAVTTSIDALAVGISFSFLNINIIKPVIIIGLVTFLISYIGVAGGFRFGKYFNRKIIEITGGLILISIGTKILIEHLSG